MSYQTYQTYQNQTQNQGVQVSGRPAIPAGLEILAATLEAIDKASVILQNRLELVLTPASPPVSSCETAAQQSQQSAVLDQIDRIQRHAAELLARLEHITGRLDV